MLGAAETEVPDRVKTQYGLPNVDQIYRFGHAATLVFLE
jgi:hypothetical protein